jgi:hypothetical protein
MKKKKPEPFQNFRSIEKPSFRTLKIPLKTILRNHKEFQPCINELVFEMNGLVIHTYQFIRLYLLYLYNQKLELPTLDETFILYCVRTLGTRDNRGKQSANQELLGKLNSFYETKYQPLLQHEKTNLKNKTHLLPYMASQIYTCYSNNTQEHFIQHFKRFINKTTSTITEDKAILHTFKNKLLMLENDTDPIFNQWKATHLANILPNKIDKNIYYDIKVKPLDYLKGMLIMNEILEQQGSKLFQPLPLRTNIIPKHILLDTSSIASLFSPEQTKKGELLKHIKDNQTNIWNNLFNLQHKVFKNKHYSFHHQIKTDGISCCLLFIRNEFKDKKWGSKVPTVPEQEFNQIEDLSLEQLDQLKDRTIVGCDPGKHSLVYMMDDKGNKLQYTASQRKIESYGKRNQRILLQEKKKHHIVEKETKLYEQNSKTINYEKFKLYLVDKNKLNNETMEFYKRDVWRRMKFRQYSYGKKSIDTFLNKIQETFGDNILIGYGNWSRSSQMKYTMSTMNKGLRKEIHKRYDTITINEFNTTKKCCECHQNLKHYKDKENKEVYRLFVCSECVSHQDKHTVFRTRDANSAVNIMNLTKSWITKQFRPEEFCHAPSFTGLEKSEKVRQSLLKPKHR